MPSAEELSGLGLLINLLWQSHTSKSVVLLSLLALVELLVTPGLQDYIQMNSLHVANLWPSTSIL